MKHHLVILVAALLVNGSVLGCSSSTSSSPKSNGAGSSQDAGSQDAHSTSDASSSTASDASDTKGGYIANDAVPPSSDDASVQADLPKAPVITGIMTMMGALHVNWTNKEADCDQVEGERRTPAEPYTVVFKVPGENDNRMDSKATGDVDYTYRLRCRKGNDYSEYSNEKTANPSK